MITKLTKKQEEGILEWRQHCLEIGRDTSPIDKKVVEKSWKKFYSLLGYGEPKFWYCQSPLQAQVIINAFPEIIKNVIAKEIGNNIGDNIWNNIRYNISNNIRYNIRNNISNNIGNNIRNNIRDNIWDNIRNNTINFKLIETYSWCQHDIEWISYYLFYEKYALLPTDKNFSIFNIWYDLARSCGWCYTFENIVFVCEKPSELNLNEAGQLHKDGDMALKYSDGYGLWMLDGIMLPEYLVKTPAHELDIEFFKNEKSADVRAAFIRKYDITRMISLGKKIDTYKNYPADKKSQALDYIDWWHKSEYELIDMSPIFSTYDFAPHLKMKNQTTGAWHLEGVSPECNTLEKALAFKFKNKHKQIKSID